MKCTQQTFYNLNFTKSGESKFFCKLGNTKLCINTETDFVGKIK